MKRLLVLMALQLFVVSAYAGPINSPVPSDAYIVYDNLDWAWGGPCPYSGGCYATGDLSYQGTQGWGLPTASELALIPSGFASDFITGSGNVPYGGTDPVSGAYFSSAVSPALSGACATPYFSSNSTWCDFSDGASGYWAGVTNPYPYYSEQLYVRSASPIPEPSSLVLMGTYILGMAGFLGRKLIK
jgi:hypothetical protein